MIQQIYEKQNLPPLDALPEIIPGALDKIAEQVTVPVEISEETAINLRRNKLDESSIWYLGEPSAISEAYIKRFQITGDVQDLTKARAQALASPNASAKWTNLFAINQASKTAYGIIDEQDVKKLWKIAAKTPRNFTAQQKWLIRTLFMADLTEKKEDFEKTREFTHRLTDYTQSQTGCASSAATALMLYKLTGSQDDLNLATEAAGKYGLDNPSLKAKMTEFLTIVVETSLKTGNNTLWMHAVEITSAYNKSKYSTPIRNRSTKLGKLAMPQDSRG